MDPITIAIVTALGKLSEKVINDAYEALKAAIADKCGVDSKLLRAVKDLEEDPDSKGAKMVVEEQVTKTSADKDTTILEATQTLQALLDKYQDKIAGTTVIKQKAGDNAIQIGQVSRDVNIKR